MNLILTEAAPDDLQPICDYTLKMGVPSKKRDTLKQPPFCDTSLLNQFIFLLE